MTDFDDDPRVPEAFDRLRSDADRLDAMAPLLAVRGRVGRSRKLAWGLAGGAVAALLVIVGLAVFGDDDPDDVVAGGGELTVADLDGTEWELVEGFGPEGDVEIIPGYIATVGFGDGSIGGSTSCNSYGVDIALEPLTATTARMGFDGARFQQLAGCLEEGVDEAESAFNAALADVTDLALVDGMLELTGPNTRLLFRQITDDGAPRPLTDTEGDIVDVPLRGTTWDLVDGVGPAGPIAPPAGSRVTIVFGDDDTIGGDTGCNGYGAAIELDGSRLTVGVIEGEQQGCEGAVGATEEAYLSALAAVSRIELDGASLLLLGDETRLRFRPAASEPAQPHLLTAERLGGTAWTLVDSWAPPEGSAPVPLVDGWPITLDFTTDTIGGTAACNGYGGRYVLDGAAIRLVELSWTEIGCEPDVQASEQAYLELLLAVDGGRFEDGQLVLSSELGELIFDPVAVDALAQVVDRTWVLESATSGGETLEADSARYGLQLGSDGTLTAVLACGRLDGAYVTSGAGIVPTTLAFEPGACAASERPVSDLAFSVIESGFTPTLDGDTLTLLAQGAESLTWVEGEMPPVPDGPAGLSLDDLDGTSWRLFEGLVGEVELSASEDIRLAFSGGIATAGNECNNFRPNLTLVDGAIEWGDAGVRVPGCGDGLDAFLEALTDTTLASIFPGVEPRVLELFGPDIQLNFEEVTSAPTDVVTVDELLDLRPTGQVTLDGTIIAYGGTTIVCGADEIREGNPPLCPGRWVTVTNYNSLVDGGALSGVLRDDGRFQIVGPGSGVLERPSGVEATDADERLVELFAAGEAPASIGDPDRSFFTPDVSLWLGNQVERAVAAAELSDPAAWTIDVDNFNGWSGPFSVLDVLENFANRDPDLPATGLSSTVGPHDHCASQPILLPRSLQGLRQISLQPEGIDSCLQWFAVEVFLNDDGRIVAVMLDLWEP